MICQRPIKSLSDLMDGSVEERFNAELDKVWQNVFDPNTDPKKTRTLTLKVKIIPNERRDSCDFRVKRHVVACFLYRYVPDGHAIGRRRWNDHGYRADRPGAGTA